MARRFTNPDLQLSVALGERKKTVKLISESARKIARSATEFRDKTLKGRAGSLRDAVRRAPKSWLEHQFGWTPTLLDLRGAAKYLGEYGERDYDARPHVTQKVEDTYEEPVKREMTVVTLGPQITVYLDVMTETRRIVTCKIRSDAEVIFPALLALTKIGLDNPLSHGWERLPFSWVVDQFFTVGDALSQLNLLDPYRFLATCETTRVDAFVTKTASPGRVVSGNWVEPGYARCAGRGSAFQRVVPVNPRPIARLMMRDDPWNLQMLATDLSLLATVFDGGVTGGRRDIVKRLRV